MFCRKNKKYYFAKKWGCHGTTGTPGVDGPGVYQIMEDFAVNLLWILLFLQKALTNPIICDLFDIRLIWYEDGKKKKKMIKLENIQTYPFKTTKKT